MAPEMSSGAETGSIEDLASSFGFDLPMGQTSDAISPLLYPNLMEDNGFVVDLFGVKVRTADNTVHTDYYTYLRKYHESPWWIKLLGLLKAKEAQPAAKNKTIDPYHLSKTENDYVSIIRNSIKIATDKKTGVISISVEAQDPMVCKMVADATRAHLQKFITEYRTRKLKNDVAHYQSLVNQAKKDYEDVRNRYGRISDSDMDVVLESVKLKQNDLENDMQLKYNAYSTLTTQLKAASAKLQEHTPVFTTIQGAEVPLKPSGPKRMLFVIEMLIVAFAGLSVYVIRDILY